MANLDKIRARGEKRRARKAARKERRGKRIEARKGLKAGEGAKVIENRRTRRREIYKDPEAGKDMFTEKYKPQLASSPGEDMAMQQRQESLQDTTKMVGNQLQPDRTDITSNATSAFFKKKGY